MEIKIWSVGKTKFTADPEYQEPVIREAVDQRGDVASVIIGDAGFDRSDISYDDYARVTGDVPDLVLFEGWLTGDRAAPPPADALAADEHAAAVTAAVPAHAATLQELVAAYQAGAVTGPLMLDNDSTNVYQGDDDEVFEVFEMHPAELIEQALTMLGIPWEHV